MMRLDGFNQRLQAIGTQFQKGDVKMITLIMSKLPGATYRPYTTAYGITGYATTSTAATGGNPGSALYDFQTKLREYWKSNIKSVKKEINISMSTINVSATETSTNTST